MDWQDVADGLAEALRRVEGLNVYDYDVPSPALPAGLVGLPDSGGPRSDTFADDPTETQDFPLIILVPSVDVRSARHELNLLLSTTGPRSIQAALEEDSTLGGRVDDIRWLGWDAETFTFGEQVHNGVRINIQVVG